VAVYLHTILLILFGAVLIESGVRLISIHFWLIVSIVFGILLTYDIITNETDILEKKDEKKDEKL